uniref:FATC domain-containing protein n=1 Tax=Plectus sambesii TaxID=2011161 RepID=A0A914V7K0_9BILA
MDSRDSSAFLGKARKEERYDVGDYPQTEIISKKAIAVIDRIRSKLNGRDFQSYNPTSNQLIDCSVSDQVRKLIEQATSHENLCQCYIGWCPFW